MKDFLVNNFGKGVEAVNGLLSTLGVEAQLTNTSAIACIGVLVAIGVIYKYR